MTWSSFCTSPSERAGGNSSPAFSSRKRILRSRAFFREHGTTRICSKMHGIISPFVGALLSMKITLNAPCSQKMQSTNTWIMIEQSAKPLDLQPIRQACCFDPRWMFTILWRTCVVLHICPMFPKTKQSAAGWQLIPQRIRLGKRGCPLWNMIGIRCKIPNCGRFLLSNGRN